MFTLSCLLFPADVTKQVMSWFLARYLVINIVNKTKEGSGMQVRSEIPACVFRSMLPLMCVCRTCSCEVVCVVIFRALQCYIRHSTWSATPWCVICCWKMDGKRARGLYLQPEADATTKCRNVWAQKEMRSAFSVRISPSITFGFQTIIFQEFGFK